MEGRVKARSHGAEHHNTGIDTGEWRREGKHHRQTGARNWPAPAAGLSAAEREKTEALRRSVLDLMQAHQATLLWLNNDAASSCCREADC
jgi:hypothetical protein